LGTNACPALIGSALRVDMSDESIYAFIGKTSSIQEYFLHTGKTFFDVNEIYSGRRYPKT